MKAVHNQRTQTTTTDKLVIAHVKLQNESSSQRGGFFWIYRKTCDCSRKITK